MTKVIYVLSDNRSGSTLLDQLLGAHDRIVSLGEVHHLPAYVLQDRSLYNPVHPLNCACGADIGRCPFWTNVEKAMGRSLGSLNLKLRFSATAKRIDNPALRSLNRLPRRFLTRNPRLLFNPIGWTFFGAHRVAADSFDLFDAVCAVTQTEYVVDSSKEPFRFRALYDREPRRLVPLILARDYRGVVHSNMKRGGDLRASAKAWVTRMSLISKLTADIPSSSIIRLRYEDLCRNPRLVLGSICDQLALEFTEALLARPSSGVHHLGGSPSKFDPSRKSIKLDESYLGSFTKEDLATMRNIAAGVAADWGYV